MKPAPLHRLTPSRRLFRAPPDYASWIRAVAAMALLAAVMYMMDWMQ